MAKLKNPIKELVKVLKKGTHHVKKHARKIRHHKGVL